MRKRRGFPLIVFAITAVAAGAALDTASGAVPAHKTKTVHVGDDFYSAGKVKIKKGDSVKWTWGNGTSDAHTVTEINNKWGSHLMTSGAFKHKFKKVGTFRVFCTEHPDDMQMKVVVKK